MNERMQEQLLGYLLGALDAPEREEVERQLDEHPDWRQELQKLERTLEPLADSYEEHDPPTGLADRTCAAVAKRVEDAKATPAKAAFSQAMVDPAETRWKLADVVVAAGICLAAALLFFPAIAQSRYLARINACQNNLQQLGIALTSFSDKAGAGYYPTIPTEGNLSFVGMYAPMLMEAGYLTNHDRVLCPDSSLMLDRNEWHIPSTDELSQAEGPVLMLMRRNAGGSYGYSLGVIVDGRYRAPRQLGRAYFALMADAPSVDSMGYSSSNHGRGQNILFEDGHVRFVVDYEDDRDFDHPFQNRWGLVAAGVDEDDAVVGPGHASPFSTPVAYRPGR